MKLMTKFAKVGPTLLPNTILEEPALLADHANFALAINEVRAVLEQAIRLCKTNDAKNCKEMFIVNLLKIIVWIIGTIKFDFELLILDMV